MEWKSAAEASLCGTDSVLPELELAWLLGDHDPKEAAYVMDVDGAQVILRVTDDGLATCLARIPAGSLPVGDVKGDVLFERGSWPEDWVTKRRVSEPERRKSRGGYERGWACCMTGKGREVRLAKVLAYDGDQVLSVQMQPDAPPSSGRSLKWWPVGEHSAGWEVLWERGAYVIANYGIAVQWARRAAAGDAGAEQRSERAKKAWETRRTKKAAEDEATKERIAAAVKWAGEDFRKRNPGLLDK